MRLFILTLSIVCVVAYGYALAGYMGYTFDRGRLDYIVWGLSVGTFCGFAAMRLWKKWMPLYLIEDEKTQEGEAKSNKESEARSLEDGSGHSDL